PRPQLLPGGKAILFSTNMGGNVDQWNIEVFTLADRHRKIVARGGTSARYLATSSGAGHLVYVNKATLFAAPFDLETLEVRGTATHAGARTANTSSSPLKEVAFSRRARMAAPNPKR